MSKIVFRNFDKKCIRQLLKEIGKERYECALKDSEVEHTPLSLEGFFVEYETDTLKVSLYYRYPSRTVFFIMSVLGYWGIPNDGWEMHRKD